MNMTLNIARTTGMNMRSKYYLESAFFVSTYSFGTILKDIFERGWMHSIRLSNVLACTNTSGSNISTLN